ncbi:lytic transglycosylase domain-containing protein [Pseudomonas aeruginosa]|uniref:Transglycosylase SLT domain protein n=2 Tax=Pseudomonas aeruginosa TaxID=287 RepID=A0A9P1VYY7_PSEAI|nr:MULTISPECIES: lytic transglycosylase domain-containing protein [Pseudomonas]KFF32776.1 conjugal transfer protein [Pseudomonas aeruginosa VRFPA01]SCZ07005.1 conjugal transfer protein TrbN [Acinetobacter baumannii]EKV3606882.1 lytic transglycosylase domain-containing protein [Pseudomonas aeruginosa]EKW6796067.1 lytic transglycosylase domain-containing protein [Pseudomonas aeruginosa]EKX7258131.1 lytic transglycosylase domain-containing protein [Pseudomonas aeruginosa]
MAFDLPPAFLHEEVPRSCVVLTLQRYQIPPDLFIGYMGMERGRVGMANRNSNGSYDYGPSQVNSIWLQEISQFGVTAAQLQWNPCVNIWVGGWIMRRCLNKFPGQFWTAVGCYHIGEHALETADLSLRARRMARGQNYAREVYSVMTKYRQPFWQWLNNRSAYAQLPEVGSPAQGQAASPSKSEVASR